MIILPQKKFWKIWTSKIQRFVKIIFLLKNKIQTLRLWRRSRNLESEIQKGITLKDHLKLKDILIFEPARNLNQKNSGLCNFF